MSRTAAKRKKRGSVQRWHARSDLWIYLLLAAATLAVYAQVREFGYVTYDDPDYVVSNPHVQNGLTRDGVVWAFTSSYAANWLPLTWISHMLDRQLFGPDFGAQHVMNLLFHAIGALLLFAFLQRATGARRRSAFVAFLFALHPLHVQSVAWLAERKDVLSAFFWFLTLWFYARYVERPDGRRYALVLLSFCLGLLAKPMVVTLPVVLLLLDVWPLGRRAIREKIPLFALSAAAAVVTYLVQAHGGAAASAEVTPVVTRFENAIVSYVVYILNFFWPARLAVFYPYPRALPAAEVIAAGLVLLMISVVALRWFRKRPYFAVGWLWYLATLLPVIGLVQVGGQARADRYSYIPLVGIFIMLAWGGAEILQPWPRLRMALAAAVCGACAVLTYIQVQYWRDSETLYRRAIEVTSDNYVARMNLAEILQTEGNINEAMAQLQEVLRLRPYYATAHWELGAAMAQQGQTQEALQHLQEAVKLKPDDADAHFHLGVVLGDLRRPEEAAAEFRDTIRLKPDNEHAHYNLGNMLAAQRKFGEALPEFSAAVRLNPDDAAQRVNLGITLASLGRLDEAIAQFSEALRIKPDLAEAQENLQYALSLKNSGKQ